jgi:hypothetical protein
VWWCSREAGKSNPSPAPGGQDRTNGHRPCRDIVRNTVQRHTPLLSSRSFGRRESVRLHSPHRAGDRFRPSALGGYRACCITAVEGAGEGTFIRSVYSGRFRSEVRPNPLGRPDRHAGGVQARKGRHAGPGKREDCSAQAFELSTKTRAPARPSMQT